MTEEKLETPLDKIQFLQESQKNTKIWIGSIMGVILILFLFLTGCAIKHDYVWIEYPIAPEQITSQNSFTEGKEIRIIKGMTPIISIIITPRKVPKIIDSLLIGSTFNSW